MSGRAVWQVSAGPTDGSYADEFVNHGVALIGPGDAGPWHSERSDEEFEGPWVRRFATELSIGDALLLRTGLTTIHAVGLVASDYQLPAAVRRRERMGSATWQTRALVPDCWNRTTSTAQSLVPCPPRLSRVQSQDVVGYTKQFVQSPPTEWQTRALPSMPVEEATLEAPPAELHQPCRSGSRPVGTLLGTRDVLRGAPHGGRTGRTLRRSLFCGHLGWPAERIAVKWRHIDVSVFSELPRTPRALPLPD